MSLNGPKWEIVCTIKRPGLMGRSTLSIALGSAFPESTSACDQVVCQHVRKVLPHTPCTVRWTLRAVHVLEAVGTVEIL
jgi:hypothetical protein